MVQLANPGKLSRHSDRMAAPPPPPSAVPAVKTEFEDPLEEEHGPLNKRPRNPSFNQWGEDASMVQPQTAHYSLLDEPSPLGLRLKKSPSLLELIQMRLSQGSFDAPSGTTSGGAAFEVEKRDMKSTAMSGNNDKLKASNFPASFLKIGSWECVSRYEGDLVAKCYYAKHKLVWEVLDRGLKNKIEIQWSDIMALKATCPENGPGTLELVLARQPLFYRETNPQPRKHTLWQATTDFTNGQASIHRRHYLQCPQGLLNKHFEKLIQCDPRLNNLSQQPEITLDSPYFDPRCSVFEDPEESKAHGYNDMKDAYGPKVSGFQERGSPLDGPSVSANFDARNLAARVQTYNVSHSSGMDSRVGGQNPTTSATTTDTDDPSKWEQMKVPGLRSSMSMADLVSHLGHCINGQTTPRNPLVPTEDSLDRDMLEDLTQYLLSDTHVVSATDETSLLSRVNSLCCLIEKDPVAPETLHVDDSSDEECRGEIKPQSISRKDSFGDLLMHLPRIASLPQFLFDIEEDSEK